MIHLRHTTASNVKKSFSLIWNVSLKYSSRARKILSRGHNTVQMIRAISAQG
jgi:hypothetical protein